MNLRPLASLRHLRSEAALQHARFARSGRSQRARHLCTLSAAPERSVVSLNPGSSSARQPAVKPWSGAVEHSVANHARNAFATSAIQGNFHAGNPQDSSPDSAPGFPWRTLLRLCCLISHAVVAAVLSGLLTPFASHAR